MFDSFFITMLWFQYCFTQFRRFYKKKTACVVDKSSNRVTELHVGGDGVSQGYINNFQEMSNIKLN